MLIICAGRSRSGSTLLYNLIRITLITLEGEKNVYGRSHRFYNRDNTSKYHIVKIHGHNNYLWNKANYIFSCNRNTEDQKESIIKFRKIIKNQILSENELNNFVKKDYERFLKWKRHKNFTKTFNFDDLIKKENIIKEIGKIFNLKLNENLVRRIIEDIDNLKFPKDKFDKESCLTSYHFTTHLIKEDVLNGRINEELY